MLWLRSVSSYIQVPLSWHLCVRDTSNWHSTHMCISPSLDKIMACCLFGIKPLSEPMLTYFQLNHNDGISMKIYLKLKKFHSIKCIWKLSSSKWQPFCLTLNMLTGEWYMKNLKYIYIYMEPELHAIWWPTKQFPMVVLMSFHDVLCCLFDSSCQFNLVTLPLVSSRWGFTRDMLT